MIEVQVSFISLCLLFSAVLIFDSQYSLTAAGEAKVLVHELSHIDIYTNSWGPPDDGETFEEPEDVVKEAFIKGVTEVNIK